MADYKMTLYFGAEEPGKTLQEQVQRLAKQKGWSLNEFCRHCIKYTILHDRTLGERRVERAVTVEGVR